MRGFVVMLSLAVLLCQVSALGVLPTIVGGSLVLGSIPLSITLLGLQIPTLGLLGVAALTKAAILKAKSGGGFLGGLAGGSGYGRGKRSTEENNLIGAIGPMLDVQAELDRQTGCGMKLICELSAKHQADEELNEEEKLLLVLFGSDQGFYSLIKSKSKGLYHLSFLMGREHGRAHCVETFDKCSWSSDDISKRF